MVTFTYEIYYLFTRKPYNREGFQGQIKSITFQKAKIHEKELFDTRLKKYQYRIKKVLPVKAEIGVYQFLEYTRSLHYNPNTKYIRTFRGWVIAENYGHAWRLIYTRYDPTDEQVWKTY